MKTCTKCSKGKERSEFYARSRSPDGLEAWCKVCRLLHNRSWWSKNKDTHRLLTKQHYERNKDSIAAAAKVRYVMNKPYHLEKYYKRDDRTKRATPPWYNGKSVGAIYAMARFLSDVVGVKYHVDHVVPLQNGKVCGLHVQNNLAIIPARDNWAKLNTVWPDMP